MWVIVFNQKPLYNCIINFPNDAAPLEQGLSVTYDDCACMDMKKTEEAEVCATTAQACTGLPGTGLWVWTDESKHASLL